MSEYLFEQGQDWTFDLLERSSEECQKIAENELNMDIYPNQIEIISTDQMLDAYASIGMPNMYKHWSWGKSYIMNEQSYRVGQSGLAYEIVINSKPVISYLMEDNTMTLQTLVIAHASYGHNNFFKNNYMFRDRTSADYILQYLEYAKKYIDECEEKYGYNRVERILDSCHALMDHGVDRGTNNRLTEENIREKLNKREKFKEETQSFLWNTIFNDNNNSETSWKSSYQKRKEKFSLPEENILYFIENYSPILEDWEREIVQIVRRISNYFVPQVNTKLMNEGTATFTHYYIMNRLYEKGLITNGSMLEFKHMHSNVVFQPTFDDKRYSGINPYALGFDLFMEIKRICENPNDEDKYYFPNLIGQNWLDVFHFAKNNFRDESFIMQYMSPNLLRKWKFFEIYNDSKEDHVLVTDIQDEDGFRNLKKSLSNQYKVSRMIPDIKIVDVNLLGNRTLHLEHYQTNNMALSEKDTSLTLRHLRNLWGYDVLLTSYDNENKFQKRFST